MKIVQMLGNKVHWVTPYPSLAEAPLFAPDIILKEVPDYVEEGYMYNTETDTFVPPGEHQELPPEPTPLELISKQLKTLESDQGSTQEMILTLASAIAEVYEILDAEASK